MLFVQPFFLLVYLPATVAAFYVARRLWGRTAGLAVIGVEAVKMATKFDSSMTLLHTQAGVAQSKMAGLKSGVLALAGKVGQDPDSLSEALFHVARHNPLLKFADGATPWLLAVNGPDAYVSPEWYVSPDQVPTWLYQSVHLTGTVRVLSDDELAVQIDTLSAKFENWLLPKKPWTSTKMTPARLETMKKAIIGLVMTVEEVEGSFKLNQHKSEADYAAVAGALQERTDTGSQQIAGLMRQARPQAFADETNKLEGNMP